MLSRTHQSAKKNKFNLSVIRKKYIQTYMIAFCAHNKLEFIQKSGLNFMRSIMDKIDYE